MNARTEAVLDCIKSYWRLWGFSPSYRDIMRGLNISSPTVVAYQLALLERAGLIKTTPRVSRSIVVQEGEDA